MSRIVLDNVTVDLPVYDGADRSFKRAVLSKGIGGRIRRDAQNRVTVRALDGVTLEIVDGDRIGLIGRNGAGKSTLLKVLAGLFEPTAGRSLIEGRVSTLLSLGSLMDPEMSGYENIDHAGALVGLAPRAREAMAAEIEAFTELGEFLDMPVRTYSSGMQMRLSFALLTAQAPEIFLLDEVIGAGDTHFAEKAMARAISVTDRSQILVVASHASATIQNMCNKALWMERGRIRCFGPVNEVINEYSRVG